MTASSPYHALFARILNVNPETQKLQDICRSLLERDFEGLSELKSLAFKSLEQGREKTPLPLDIATERKGEHETDDITIGNMSNLIEFPRILKKEFMMPDEIFDQKLLKKELLVHKKQFREKRQSWEKLFEQQCALTETKQWARQKTYILLDVSASTGQRHRLLLEKAIAIGYLQSNLKERGEVYFRAFNHSTGSLHLCQSPSDYRDLINKVIMQAEPIGQTNLQKAIETAFDDLNHHPSEHPAEILILSDGLSALDLESLFSSPPPSKIHVVLVGGDQPQLNDRDLREHFNSLHKSQISSYREIEDPKRRELLLSQLDERFRDRKEQLRSDIINDLKSQLKELCVRTQGTFIHVPDLPQELGADREQAAQIEQRIEEISQALQNPQTTVLDKEQLMDELLALRAYLRELSYQVDTNNLDLKKNFEELIERTGELTLDSQELQAMLEHLELSCRWKSNGSSEVSIPLSQWIKLTYRAIKQSLKRRSNPPKA